MTPRSRAAPTPKARCSTSKRCLASVRIASRCSVERPTNSGGAVGSGAVTGRRSSDRRPAAGSRARPGAGGGRRRRSAGRRRRGGRSPRRPCATTRCRPQRRPAEVPAPSGDGLGEEAQRRRRQVGEHPGANAVRTEDDNHVRSGCNAAPPSAPAGRHRRESPRRPGRPRHRGRASSADVEGSAGRRRPLAAARRRRQRVRVGVAIEGRRHAGNYDTRPRAGGLPHAGPPAVGRRPEWWSSTRDGSAADHGFDVTLVTTRDARTAWDFRGIEHMHVLALESGTAVAHDVAVATWWETARSLFEVPARGLPPRRHRYVVLHARARLEVQYAQVLEAREVHASSVGRVVTRVTSKPWSALRPWRPCSTTTPTPPDSWKM